MSDQKKIIMFDSAMAAHKTITEGWMSSDGHFATDERTARYMGCTHVRCGCGGIMEKHWTKCDACRDKEDLAKFEALPRAEWDGEAWLYSGTAGEFYASPDDAGDALEDGRTLGDLRLVICRPVYARRLEADDFGDKLPEGADDLPPKLEDAIQEFNKAIAGVVLSWEPGDTALKTEGAAE